MPRAHLDKGANPPQSASLPECDRLLNTHQVAEITGLSTTTLNQARIYGKDAPPYLRVGRSVRYRLSSVMAWIESKTEYHHTSASEQAAA